MIELRDITVKRSGTTVLDSLSLVVPSASFVSVLGESGAGKSTLLAVISGLLPQDSGQVLFDGEPIDDVPTYKRKVAVVFQDSRLFPNMSVAENVAFPLRMQGVPKVQRLQAASETLASVQLEGMERRAPSELSGGQRQRVALARALAGRPSAILLDEPFSGLDESLRDEMRQLVLALHEETGTTMLMVTHDAREALMMSDEMAYLSQGRVVQFGPPADILQHPAAEEVAASFGSTMAIEGAVNNGQFTCRKLTVPARGLGSGPAVLLRTHDGVVVVHALSDADAAPTQ